MNRTPVAISLLELDYPSASFGTQLLAPGATFRYRFKILGSGPTKLTYTDSAQHEHTANGPALHEGEEGMMVVSIAPAGVDWKSNLKQAR